MISEKIPWQWQEDGFTVTRSSAWAGPGCHEGCGVLLYTNRQGKLVKVEGDPEHPFNQGRLCLRCLVLPEVTNHPDRLQYPMKRIGQRGENKWQRISWDEAYDLIEAKFKEIKTAYGPEAILFHHGTARDVAPYNSRLAFSYGSPNLPSFLSGFACYIPRLVLMAATAGNFSVADCSQFFPDRYDNPDWRAPKCMIIWGNNPVVSNSDGFYGHWIVECMKRGTKLIVVDPRLTWLASRADLWLQIRPGTDAALALAMLNVIIREDLYDKEFVDKWTYGFDQLAERATDYPVERVAEITWIPPEKILAAARLFAQSKPASIQWGVAVDMTKESLSAGHAISALWNITGNLDVPGGMATSGPVFGLNLVASWGSELVSEVAKAKRIGIDKYPLYQYGRGAMYSQPDETLAAMITDKPYPIKGVWMQSTNPLACHAQDPRRVLAALRRMDFVVVTDLFMTPTAVACADVVLPSTTFPERDGARSWYYNVGAINKVTSIGECKTDLQINMELGKRLNPEAWPWESVQQALDARLKKAGITFEQLRENGVPMYPAFEYKKYEKGLERADGEVGFNTPTGRIELYSTIFEASGLDPLPYFEEPTESPVSRPDLYQEYPLVLTTGARSWGFFHSEHRQVSRLRAIKSDPELQIHPTTAAQYGIKDGDWVWIENRMGRCRQKAKLTCTIHPKVVNADHGWWYPEKSAAEPNLFGVFDVNINQLIPYLPGRSGFGSNEKSLLCRVYKVKPGEM